MLLFFKLAATRARGDAAWLRGVRLWVKVFALTFALGVVSGVTMSFQFGTNWPGFMDTVGNIAGPLLAYEVLTAFFLEATFLGDHAVRPGACRERVHTLATCAGRGRHDALGVLDPGAQLVDADAGRLRDDRRRRACRRDWLAIVFNPSLPYRLTHMLLACGLTVGVPGRRAVGVSLAARRSRRRRAR